MQRHRLPAFTMIEIIVVMAVSAVVLTTASMSLQTTMREAQAEQAVTIGTRTVINARNASVARRGPILMVPQADATKGVVVTPYSGGDCDLAARGVTATALPISGAAKNLSDRVGVAIATSTNVNSLCFRPRGGVVSYMDTTVVNSAVGAGGPLQVAYQVPGTSELLVIRNNGEITFVQGVFSYVQSFYSGTPSTKIDLPVDTGYILDVAPVMDVIRIGGVGAGDAEITRTIAPTSNNATLGVGGSAPVALGMLFTANAVKSGNVMVRTKVPENPGAYVGHLDCNQSRRLMCLKNDGSANANVQFDSPWDAGWATGTAWYDPFYSGWFPATAMATAPIPGTALTSAAEGDAICVANFGAGAYMATFHSPTGGWGWRAMAGANINAGEDYWVKMGDQPANCWNNM